MGDRFLLVRMPEEGGALEESVQALDNNGHETQMRAELSAAVGGLLQHLEPSPAERSLVGFIPPLANVTTWARTAVIVDYRGDVMDAHARERPTRFAKQLAQVYRGARCIGLTDKDACRIVTRIASDSLPPMRLAVLVALLEQVSPGTTGDIARTIGKPRTSVDRYLQALVALGMAQHGDATGAWRWWLAERVDREALESLRLPGNVGTP